MIATAWLPLIGKYIEAERLYVSSLVVNHLHPYTEWGYGVTTRAITLGFFAAFKNTKFNGIGLVIIPILTALLIKAIVLLLARMQQL